ncbi:DNA cytosine methyltransferase [Polaribacter sp.]|uniref:DNA cytosine methyltransferase n=1 Tax=Polaribacter sp. TaxID=1920175 RepID=UPI003F6BD26E
MIHFRKKKKEHRKNKQETRLKRKKAHHSKKKKPLRVVELFAGVGGFRIALEGYPKKKDAPFEVVWSNQFEPRTKKQHANIVYKNRWPNANHSEMDIEELVAHQMDVIPDHDVLVGGFPCQDFSIANRSHNNGIEGKKGKLWWAINSILEEKRPAYILLENVNRLLCSPSKQKGRDFSLILYCLNKLGYAVEWRVINAADYGFPQRRRRVFIYGFHQKTKLFHTLKNADPKAWLLQEGLAAKAFPVVQDSLLKTEKLFDSKETLIKAFKNQEVAFEKAGLMVEGRHYSIKVKPVYAKKS